MSSVGLIQVDGKIPNLALMQIAAYHRSLGDEPFLIWLDPDGQRRKRKRRAFARGMFDVADQTYASILFSFNSDILEDIQRELPDAICGGTGIDYTNKLPANIAESNPCDAWFLYPRFGAHVGFSMKGCRYRCDFCCIPTKEPGKPWVNSSIGELLKNPNGGDRLILLDNDFFGGPNWRDNLLEILDRKLKVSFCQGLNIRILTDEQATMLRKVEFYNSSFNKRQVTFAWDRIYDETKVKAGLDRAFAAGFKPYEIAFFVFVGHNTTEAEDLHRIQTIQGWGCDPYVMPKDKANPYQQRLARWVNHKPLFKSVAWQDYQKPTTNSQLEKATRLRELPVLPFLALKQQSS